MRRSGKKVGLWLAGVLLFLGVGGFIAWRWLKNDLRQPDSKVERKLSEEFADMITEASDSLYRVSYTKFDLNLDAGRGEIRNFKIIPDQKVLERLIRANKAPNNVLNIAVKTLTLSGLKVQRTPGGLRMQIASMLVDSTAMEVSNTLRVYNVNRKAEKHGRLFSIVQSLLKMSNIHRLSMRNLTFVYVNHNYNQPKRTAIKNLNVDLSGLTATEKDSAGIKGTSISLQKYRLATRDSLYHLNASNIAFFPEMRRMTIKRIELNPRLSRRAFYRKVKHAKERVYLLKKDVSLNGIDIERLLKTQQLHVGSMNVGYSLVEVYNNYNYPRRLPKKRSSPYPNQQLQLLAFDLTIDTMRIKNSDTYFKVLAMKTDKLSSLDINNCSGEIYNITNNKDAIAANKYMRGTMHYKMMGVAFSKSDMKFNLADKNGAFSYTTRMGSIDATVLNRFARPYALMAVKSGKINKMYFHIDANEFNAKGKLDCYYQDMKYAVLKKDDETNAIKERKLISAVSNLMLPNDNPTKGGKFKEGPININRPPDMSFFGLLSKAMLDGMTSSTTGMEQNKRKPESNIILEAGEAITGGSGKKTSK
jgi:hypothetical protein